jgi:hypothetical protein
VTRTETVEIGERSGWAGGRSCYEPHLLAFASSVFILGLLCAVLRAEQAAYRFGGITLAMVMLAPRTGPGRWRCGDSLKCPSESLWRWS